jgi:hypothetical protein
MDIMDMDMDVDMDDPVPGRPALADAGADGHGDGRGPWSVERGDRQMGAAKVVSPRPGRPGLGPGTARGSSGPSQGKRKRYERDQRYERDERDQRAQRDERVATGGIVSFLILILISLKSPQPLGLCVHWLPLSV